MKIPAHIQFGIEMVPKGKTRPLYKQVHGAELIEVSDSNLSELYQNPPEADGAYTYAPDIKLTVYTADCIPLLFFTDDPLGPIGVAHCGWRGAATNIARYIVQQLKTDSTRLHVILGPSIGVCCFEVKDDLIEAFKLKNHDLQPFLQLRNSKIYFSLADFVLKTQLPNIPATNIHRQYERCTHCSTPQLPSYRRDKKTDPRLQSWIRKS